MWHMYPNREGGTCALGPDARVLVIQAHTNPSYINIKKKAKSEKYEVFEA